MFVIPESLEAAVRFFVVLYYEMPFICSWNSVCKCCVLQLTSLLGGGRERCSSVYVCHFHWGRCHRCHGAVFLRYAQSDGGADLSAGLSERVRQFLLQHTSHSTWSLLWNNSSRDSWFISSFSTTRSANGTNCSKSLYIQQARGLLVRASHRAEVLRTLPWTVIWVLSYAVY